MSWNKFRAIAVVGLIFSASSSVAQVSSEQIRVPNIPQFKPVLTVNAQPELCGPYKAAWEKVYASEKGLSEANTDLHTAFPDAVHVFPNASQQAGRGYYGDSLDTPFDYDGDGENEILYLKGDHRSWRSTGVRLFFYESHEDFEADVTPEGQTDKRTPRSQHGFHNTENTKAKVLVEYPRLSSAHLFEMGGKFYSEANVTYKSGIPISASLDWVRPGEEAVSICEIKLNPKILSLDSMNASQTYSRLLQIYGGPKTGGMCYGTMGWTAKPVSSHLPDLLYRPQAMKAMMSVKGDAAREFRYISWGIKDPISFEIVQALKDSYSGFVAEMSLYYEILHDFETSEAKAAAELGYRYLLDRVYYARSSGPQMRGYDLDIGPDTPLPKIAKLAVEKAISESDSNLSVLKLGLMTGLDGKLLTQLLDISLSENNSVFKYSKLDKTAKDNLRLKLINELFLSSLKSPVMMTQLLDKGADVNGPTNYFHKTALMYAAQNNDLDIAKLLLSKGANLNSRTNSEGKHCPGPLKRDARTPLMYAAENADAALILALIQAGADISAKDSLDNSALWYLERNTHLSKMQKTTLIPNLTPQ